MEIPRNLKIGALVISGIAFAFLAGYVIFSYFSRDRQAAPQNQQVISNTPTVKVEDTDGIEPIGSVAGANDGISSGISQYPSPAGSIDMRNEEKGGVLGDTTMEKPQNGIVPTYETPKKNVITPQDREAAKKKESNRNITQVDTSDSEVSVFESPEVDEHSNYTEYTYTFAFNTDARKRYEDGFKYTIDPQTCDSSKFFTSNDYDFSGTIGSGDVEKETEIKVRIKNDYLDDTSDFDDSDYKLDGTNYVVRGDINVPVCED